MYYVLIVTDNGMPRTAYLVPHTAYLAPHADLIQNYPCFKIKFYL